MIYNSSDTSFIRRDIHGRSCRWYILIITFTYTSHIFLRVLRCIKTWHNELLVMHDKLPDIGCYRYTAYPKKYAQGFCFALLCCGYTLTDFPISIRLTSLALWQSNDCPRASKATLMNMDKYFLWIHYERLHNHNKAKHNKTVCIFLGIYCTWRSPRSAWTCLYVWCDLQRDIWNTRNGFFLPTIRYLLWMGRLKPSFDFAIHCGVQLKVPMQYRFTVVDKSFRYCL